MLVDANVVCGAADVEIEDGRICEVVSLVESVEYMVDVKDVITYGVPPPTSGNCAPVVEENCEFGVVVKASVN